MPGWLIDLTAAIPVIGAYLAPVIQVATVLFNWIWPVIENTGLIPDTMGAIGLDSITNMTSRINPLNITSGITDIPVNLQADILNITMSSANFTRRSLGDTSRIFSDLQLSWQWFMNPENPRGYRQIMRMFTLFTAPRTQPHLRVNQPPRVGFIYDFPDPYLLSYNLIPSYYVAGGRL